MRFIMLLALIGCGSAVKPERHYHIDCTRSLPEQVSEMDPAMTTVIDCTDGTLLPCSEHPLKGTNEYHACIGE